jgi:hypothetical protein
MPRCANASCGRWRPERLVPRWATGLRFNERWYCSRECVEQAARARLDAPAPTATVPALPPLRLGVLLRHLGAVSDEQLTHALNAQRASGRRLGAELQRLAFVSSEPVLRALAAQGGVSYLASFDLSRIGQGPEWLPVETVRALGLVPFEIDEPQRRVKVICSAPVPRAALRALTKLTGWLPQPYLVDDAVLEAALAAYRSASGSAVSVGATQVRDLAAAASRIADAALADRAITVRHASYDRYTWVRVEGPQHWSDVWVMGAQEESCPAAPIAH